MFKAQLDGIRQSSNKTKKVRKDKVRAERDWSSNKKDKLNLDSVDVPSFLPEITKHNKPMPVYSDVHTYNRIAYTTQKCKYRSKIQTGSAIDIDAICLNKLEEQLTRRP